METKELLLKTAFCCMACDGKIANEEIALIKKVTSESSIFDNIEVEDILNKYISAINMVGHKFLSDYIAELSTLNIDDDSALKIIDIAIKTIEADKNVEYSEISFFKRIRANLSISDAKILKHFINNDNIKEYLLPDVMIEEEANWSVSFNNIDLGNI